ncbi:MAG: ATP-dependent DNA helicase RecG [Chloroflexota bacterium]
MASAFETLAKILKLEKELGYENKAVIGGLAAMTRTWPVDAVRELPASTPLVEQIVGMLKDYDTLPGLEARQAQVARIIEKLAACRQLAVATVTEKPSPPAEPEREAFETAPVIASGAPAAPAPRSAPRLGLDSPVTTLSGVGEKKLQQFRRLGVETIYDLIYHFPHRYNDFSALKTINQLTYGEEATVIGTIWETKARHTRSGGVIVQSIIADGTGTVEATWFNQPFLAKSLKAERQVVLSGAVDAYLGRLVMKSPEWEFLEKEQIHTGRLVPVYPLTEGIKAKWLRRLIKRTVDYWTKRMPDYLPRSVRESLGLPALENALIQIHFPDDWQSLEQARRRLSFDEFLLIQLGVLRQRQMWQARPGRALESRPALLEAFFSSLPFALTAAQRRAIDEIAGDMQQSRPMSRLLQGDVGSGKTVVAAAAMLLAAVGEAQAVLMAPTEILAEQHFNSLNTLYGRLAALSDDGTAPALPQVRILTGSVIGAAREQIYADIASGRANIVVGTHALIQKGVDFKDLALTIVDEQHRFGVEQRAALRQKGHNPHMLVMTATPIPRTLSLTMYGDLDISTLDEMPPGRQPVETRWFLPRERERAYNFIRNQVEKGYQAFIICPLVEGSDRIEAKAAVEEYERLQSSIFPDLRLGLLHGRLKSGDKELVMAQFQARELDVLVSTSVVEVGIDVPNATVMMVEGANRFGLAQLHQFRGRVGRGQAQSYCILLSDSPGEDSVERLRAIESTQDGFELAETDLEMRGPGEFFGTRQSGMPPLQVARLSDRRILEQARQAAKEIFERDPSLEDPDHRLLARKLAEFWRGRGDLS